MLNKHSNILIILLLIIPICIHAIAVSDSTKVKKRVYQLNKVRIIGQYPEATIGKLTVKDYGEVLAKESNLADAVREISGLSVTVGAKSESSVRIRAFQKTDLKVMIDGRPLNAGYFGNVNLDEVPMADMQSVTVVKGPTASIYGTNSMGGVINFITARPSKDDWAKLITRIKRNNTNQAQLILSHSFPDWDYWVSAQRNNTEGFVLSNQFKPTNSEDGKVRDHSNKNQFDYQAKVNYTLFDLHSVGVTGGYTYMAEKGIPTSIYSKNYRRYTDWKRYQASGISSFQLSGNLVLNANVFYDVYNNTYEEYSDESLTQQTLKSILENWNLGADSRMAYTYGNGNTLRFGYRIEKQVYNRKDNQGYLLWTSNHVILNNIFLQNEAYINHYWSLTTGCGLSNAHRKNDNETINTDLYMEPSIGLFYKPKAGTQYALAYSSSVQYPTLHELYSHSKGNIHLKPVRANKYEISAENALPLSYITFKLENSIYYNEINRLIETYGNQYINARLLKNYGFESTVSALYHKVNMSAQYSLIELKENGSYKFYDISPNAVTLQCNSPITNIVSLQWTSKYQDICISRDDETDIEHTLDSYWLHSVAIDAKWHKYKLLFSVDNLFDKDYQEEYGYPGSGINYTLALEMVLF